MTMVNTAEMTGRALDWAVGYIRCLEVTGGKPILARDMMAAAIRNGMASPSTDWAQGGPIKEKECIATRYSKGKWYAMRSEDLGDGERAQWCKFTFRDAPKSVSTSRQCRFEAESELAAVMRCHVAHRLGTQVDVPDELLGESAGEDTHPAPDEEHSSPKG